jgi:hypothetical protein
MYWCGQISGPEWAILCQRFPCTKGEKGHMFEGIVSDLVVRICGDYIQGINKEQLDISVWSGKTRFLVRNR